MSLGPPCFAWRLACRQGPGGHGERGGNCTGRHQQRFNEELADDVEPTGTEREAGAQLADPRPRARHRNRTKVGDSDDEQGQRGTP